MRTVIKVFISLLLIAAIVLGAVWALLPPQRSAIYLWLAESAVESGRDERAAKWYESSLKTDPGNGNARQSAIRFYLESSNYTKAEYHLLRGIQAEPGNAYYYRELSRIYVEQGKLYDAVNLVDTIADPVIAKKLAAERPSQPAISPESGLYRGSLTVSITSPEGTRIYCATGGDFPTLNHSYTGEFMPEPGETQIIAVCVNDNGLVSPAASSSFRYEPDVAAVQFKDAGAEKILRAILNLPAGDVSSGALRTIRTFSNSIDGETIALSSTEDLVWCPDLEELSLVGVESPLDSISGLQSLRVLSLIQCGVSDTSPIAGLQNLEHLDLTHNRIASLSGLRDLPKLERLILRQNSIVDITPVGDFQTLLHLDVGENAIVDLSPLKNCVLLQTLALDRNKLTDISALSSLLRLMQCDLSRNSISDLSPLKACSLLTTLDCSSNSIEILDALQFCKELTSLLAAKNNISDVTPLGALTELNILDLSENVIQNARALAGCSSLKTLNLSKNFLSDVSEFAVLTNLMELNIENNTVKDLSKLAECPALQTVYAFGNGIKSAEKLEEAGIIVYK